MVKKITPYLVYKRSKVLAGLLFLIIIGFCLTNIPFVSPHPSPSPQRGEGNKLSPSPLWGEGRGEGDNSIDVLLLDEVKDFTLTVKGYYKIYSIDKKELLYEGKNISESKVSCSKSGINIGKLRFNVSIEIEPRKSSYIYVNNLRYRGNLRIIKTAGLRLRVVNRLDIEDYLRGVLRQEVSHRWPMHTLMAQAIAARTYALYQKSISQSKDFDVTADVSSQMYGGVYSETWRTNRAVVHTKAEVLTFKGKLFPAYYHATCAGKTEDASVLWNIDMPPLDGRVCNFCKESPHFNWSRKIALKDIELKLRNKGLKVKDIKNIAIVERNNSGRIVRLEIIDSAGKTYIQAKEFRQILGSDIIHSTNFSIEIKDGIANLKGFGWGHGVGLCQWGAYKMARLGYEFNQILEFYYPGSKIKNSY